MLVITGAMAWSYALRPRLDIAVQRDRAPLFVTLQDGTIRNAYTFKVSNKTRQNRSYTLAAGGIAGAEVKVVGESEEDTGSAVSHISASPDSVATYRVYVTAPRASVPEPSTPVTFELTDTHNGDRDSYKSVFLAPGSK